MIRIRSYRRRVATTGLVALAVLATLLGVAAPAQAQQGTATCRPVTIAATYTLLIPVTVAGQLCVPASGDTATVEVLIPGATYNKSYYDAPGASYQRQEAADGVATLAIDRIGTGASTRLPSVTITGSGQANIISQVITAVRDGGVTGTPVTQVDLLGHSLGSMISVLVASTYHDVDKLILTGYTHALPASVLIKVFTSYLHPAIADPKFAGRTLDPGELTTVPGVREAMFDTPDNVDPSVVAADESTLKEVVSTTEVADAVALGEYVPSSLAITAPTLIVNGQNDALICSPTICANSASLRAEEAPYYGAPVSAFVQPDAGHSIAIAANGALGAEAVANWVRG